RRQKSRKKGRLKERRQRQRKRHGRRSRGILGRKRSLLPQPTPPSLETLPLSLSRSLSLLRAHLKRPLLQNLKRPRQPVEAESSKHQSGSKRTPRTLQSLKKRARKNDAERNDIIGTRRKRPKSNRKR